MSLPRDELWQIGHARPKPNRKGMKRRDASQETREDQGPVFTPRGTSMAWAVKKSQLEVAFFKAGRLQGRKATRTSDLSQIETPFSAQTSKPLAYQHTIYNCPTSPQCPAEAPPNKQKKHDPASFCNPHMWHVDSLINQFVSVISLGDGC